MHNRVLLLLHVYSLFLRRLRRRWWSGRDHSPRCSERYMLFIATIAIVLFDLAGLEYIYIKRRWKKELEINIYPYVSTLIYSHVAALRRMKSARLLLLLLLLAVCTAQACFKKPFLFTRTGREGMNTMWSVNTMYACLYTSYVHCCSTAETFRKKQRQPHCECSLRGSPLRLSRLRPGVCVCIREYKYIHMRIHTHAHSLARLSMPFAFSF